MVEKRFVINRETYNYNKKGDLTTEFYEEFNDFENKYNTFYEEIYDEGEQYIPITAFSSEIGCLQAIIKYLKDYEQLKYSEIAKLINRDQRTVWNAYNQAKNTSVKINETTLYIPLSIIADRKENVLGSIILYLKDNGFSYKKIASLLQRNYQTIYTTYRKTRRKSNE